MAIINNLALSMGGGIISLKQQAKQADNTVSILIGLGGTGIDCIREIKTQVYSRIEPDDGENATVARYRHIRFLGVDADDANVSQDDNPEDKKTAETLSLSEDEAFTLARSGVKLKAVKKARDVYTQYAWISDEIEQTKMEGSGAGGVRQVGRFLLMSKAADFMTKLQNLISDAKIGLESPKVVVHIFSGMGGGTGCLTPFILNEDIMDATANSTFDVRDLVEKKCAIFIITKDEGSVYNKLISANIDQIYERLIDIAEEEYDGRLPRRINFILDEFGNLAAINNMQGKITAGRSRNIRWLIVCQNMEQLNLLYGDKGASIIFGNCANIVYLYSTDIKLLQRISAMCGLYSDELTGARHPLMSMDHLR